jgi:hypothetical protein
LGTPLARRHRTNVSPDPPAPGAVGPELVTPSPVAMVDPVVVAALAAAVDAGVVAPRTGPGPACLAGFEPRTSCPTPATGVASGTTAGRQGSRRVKDVSRSVEGEDFVDAGRFGVRNEVGLGEVKTLQLIDLEGPQQGCGINSLDCRQRDRGTHQLGDTHTLDLVRRLQHVDALGNDKVGQQEISFTGEGGGGACRHLGRIASQVANQNAGIGERRQRRRPARSLRVRRSTSPHAIPRLPAGTLTVPAEIEARACEAVQRDGPGWNEVSVFCVVEQAPGEPHTWLFGFSTEPLPPGDQVQLQGVATRLTGTRYVSVQDTRAARAAD